MLGHPGGALRAAPVTRLADVAVEQTGGAAPDVGDRGELPGRAALRVVVGCVHGVWGDGVGAIADLSQGGCAGRPKSTLVARLFPQQACTPRSTPRSFPRSRRAAGVYRGSPGGRWFASRTYGAAIARAVSTAEIMGSGISRSIKSDCGS